MFRITSGNNSTRLRLILVRMQGTPADAYQADVSAGVTPQTDQKTSILQRPLADWI
ncbi:MAG: hypothetical protein Q7T50_01910 [Candidatus Magasanikbacteria bacterium]|nr:hypothetical protein [Candidatus Magasanikbacteria bacterium]